MFMPGGGDFFSCCVFSCFLFLNVFENERWRIFNLGSFANCCSYFCGLLIRLIFIFLWLTFYMFLLHLTGIDVQNFFFLLIFSTSTMLWRLNYASIFSFYFVDFTSVRKYWGNKKCLSWCYSASWAETVYQCNLLLRVLLRLLFRPAPHIITGLRYTLSNAAYTVCGFALLFWIGHAVVCSSHMEALLCWYMYSFSSQFHHCWL